MKEYTEQELIAGCCRGDRMIQEALYKAYYSIFLKVCVRYSKSMEDAEQVLNDGFLKIFTKISSFDNAGSFAGWMRRIMVNTCLDYLRSHELKTGMQMHVNTDKLEDNFSHSSTNAGLEHLEFKELVTLIQSLPVMTRTVFNLFVFDGMTHKQIAEVLPISEGTSHWHVHQARNVLQKKIKNLNATATVYANK